MRNPFARKTSPALAAKTSDERLQALAEGDEVVVAAPDGRTPVADWLTRFPEAAPAIAGLLAAAEDGRQETDGRLSVELEQGRARLRPAFVAGLDGAAANMLGLPAPTPLALDLKPSGRIDEDGFHVATRWVEPGGRPVLARLEGALIKTDAGVRRAPEPLWSLYREAQALAQPLDRAERFRRLAELQRVWPESERRVQADGYLRDLRVHYASALSLHLDALTPEKTEFSPVLFGARSVSEAEDAGRALDEDLDNVLTPAAQRLFAEDRFPREKEARPVYVLRDGEFIFVDPALRPALEAVRQLQDAPEIDRRAFVLNPRQVLRDRLGEETADRLDLDRLFVETEQFSTRVAGVDVWRKPVLPWLTPGAKNQWLPEKFGLRVGDDYFVIPPEHAGEIHRRVEDAAGAGLETAAVDGLLESAVSDGPAPPSLLPVNELTRAAVRALEPFTRWLSGKGPGAEETAPPWDAEANGKLFLIVRENFEEVEFAPFAEAATATEPEPAIEAPKRLRTQLKPHQLEGLEWLAQCVRARRPGALLADDMGLGKTLQAIAFMAWLQEEAEAGRRPAEPFLIVAPTGLLGTWRKEIARHLEAPRQGLGLGLLVPAFGSDLKILREESGFAGRDIETGRAALKAAAWRDAGVVLTTYETLRDYHFSFARTRFGLVVYDEIQKLKNPASQMTRAAKALNARFVLGMTGTPVENRLQDLWSIMDIVSPGLLGAGRDYDRRYPSDDRQALAALKALLSEPRDGRPAYMLRRLKSEALEGMPAKTVHPFETDMPEMQAQAYRDLAVKAAAGAASGSVGQGGMLGVLAQMRGVSLHPLDPRQAPDDLDAYAKDSARLAKTLAVLDDIAARNEKALIFVEDLPMQERLAAMIKARFNLPSAPMRINGAVPGARRQAMVDAFQNSRRGFDVMILSPKAGGVGLTLTAANHVIHLSRWWNPAVEDQATDRVFRIGQTRDVHVYLPMAVHPDPALRPSSFDLRLNALIERKRRLTQDLFLPPEADDDDLTGLFREVSLAAEAPAASDADRAAAPAGKAAAARPTLSLPRPAAETGARVWVRETGQPRPTAEILELFRNKDVAAVRIRDPYALASHGQRTAQVRFVAELSKVCRSLENVLIEYAPEVDSDLDEAAARREISALFARALAGAAPPLSLVRRPRRSRDDDFHDRAVELDIRHAGGAVRQHTLLLGRGVEALFDDRRQCTAAYAPPSA